MKRKKRKPSLCSNTKNGKCEGVYVVVYEQGAPIFVCDQCRDRNETWLKFYKEYLLLYKDNNNWEQDRHKTSCILGLFCGLYRKLYNTDYVFVPQNPNPYSSKESKDAAKLLAAFQNNAVEAGKYLIWCFKDGISSRSKVVSFAYILTPALLRKFKLIQQENKKMTRITPLPKKFIEQCKKEIPEIFDIYELNNLGDLSLLIKTMSTYNLTEESFEHKALKIAKDCGINTKNIGVVR